MPSSTPARSRRRWVDAEAAAHAQALAMPNLDRLHGGPPRFVAPEVAVARRLLLTGPPHNGRQRMPALVRLR